MTAALADGLTVRRYVAVVHVEVTTDVDPNTAAQAAADLLTAGVTDPGEDIQIVSLTEVAR